MRSPGWSAGTAHRLLLILLIHVKWASLQGATESHELVHDRFVRPRARAPGLLAQPFTQLRVVGGEDETNFKWAVKITGIGGKGILCTGTLIAPRWVVTAGHCVLNSDNSGYASPEGSSLFVGCTKACTPGTYACECKRAGVERIVVHPCYTPSDFEDHDDIALLRLDRDFASVAPLLVNGLNGTVPVAVGAEASLLGFGATQPSGSKPASTLQRVKVDVASQKQCEVRCPPRPQGCPTLLGFPCCPFRRQQQ